MAENKVHKAKLSNKWDLLWEKSPIIAFSGERSLLLRKRLIDNINSFLQGKRDKCSINMNENKNEDASCYQSLD